MFLRSKSALFGRQVLHKSFMSSYNVRLLHGRHSIGHNVLRLGEGGDFQHKLSYEALMFIYPQNCPTKH